MVKISTRRAFRTAGSRICAWLCLVTIGEGSSSKNEREQRNSTFPFQDRLLAEATSATLEQDVITHRDVFCLIANPWSGLAAQLERELAWGLQDYLPETVALRRASEHAFQQLQEVYQLGDNPTVLLLRSGLNYTYQGELRSEHVIRMIQYVAATRPEDLPVRNLKSMEELLRLVKSADVSVVAFDRCSNLAGEQLTSSDCAQARLSFDLAARQFALSPTIRFAEVLDELTIAQLGVPLDREHTVMAFRAGRAPSVCPECTSVPMLRKWLEAEASPLVTRAQVNVFPGVPLSGLLGEAAQQRRPVAVLAVHRIVPRGMMDADGELVDDAQDHDVNEKALRGTASLVNLERKRGRATLMHEQRPVSAEAQQTSSEATGTADAVHSPIHDVAVEVPGARTRSMAYFYIDLDREVVPGSFASKLGVTALPSFSIWNTSSNDVFVLPGFQPISDRIEEFVEEFWANRLTPWVPSEAEPHTRPESKLRATTAAELEQMLVKCPLNNSTVAGGGAEEHRSRDHGSGTCVPTW
ncbi:hypothetical protein CYMTET_3190 [Cymbomonas tetramitiformis]|uniref:Thioredoxin domain-containing protein n=1 Tax=Cymbomonas tetramitiformis TaxID=36881 RepID=A0AAE0H3M3_9CHLO|nr:hypothetical protein CYMTET_3190 [Cymbomonas tetramitiformis]